LANVLTNKTKLVNHGWLSQVYQQQTCQCHLTDEQQLSITVVSFQFAN